MENHKLVLPVHLNHYGFLFGGNLLKWVDEYAYIAAKAVCPQGNFVTVSMDTVEFKKPVTKGSILAFILETKKEGNTSIQFSVEVYCTSVRGARENVFTTNVTLVRVDEQGQVFPLRA